MNSSLPCGCGGGDADSIAGGWGWFANGAQAGADDEEDVCGGHAVDVVVEGEGCHVLRRRRGRQRRGVTEMRDCKAVVVPEEGDMKRKKNWQRTSANAPVPKLKQGDHGLWDRCIT